MMSPNLFYQDFLLCIGVASLIFGLFLLFFKAPANNIYQPYRRSKSLLAAGYHEPQHYVLGHHFR